MFKRHLSIYAQVIWFLPLHGYITCVYQVSNRGPIIFKQNSSSKKHDRLNIYIYKFVKKKKNYFGSSTCPGFLLNAELASHTRMLIIIYLFILTGTCCVFRPFSFICFSIYFFRILVFSMFSIPYKSEVDWSYGPLTPSRFFHVFRWSVLRWEWNWTGIFIILLHAN